MEDEIDLGKYILLLVNSWKWIVGAAIFLALIAALISKFILTPTFEAKALLLIIQPQYTITFDPKFTTQTKPDLLYYGPIKDLATRDDVAQTLYDAWTSQHEATFTLEQLKGMMSVADNTSVTTIELIITSKDAEISSQLANLWAEVLLEKADAIFTDQAQGENTISEQFTQSETAREAAQQALVEFEGQNELLIAQSELSVTQTTYLQFLTDQATLQQLITDVEDLQSQVNGAAPDAEISFDTELTALLLQLKTYGLDQPVQLNFDAQPLTSTWTTREINLHLERLHEVLIRRDEQIASQIPPFKTNILALQSQIKALQTTQKQLEQNYQIASDTYLVLARKIQETNISDQVSNGSVRLASEAVIPDKPIGPRTLFNTLLAGIGGLLLSIMIILGQDIWKGLSAPNKSAQA